MALLRNGHRKTEKGQNDTNYPLLEARARARAYSNDNKKAIDRSAATGEMITDNNAMAPDHNAAAEKKDNRYAGETPAPPRGKEVMKWRQVHGVRYSLETNDGRPTTSKLRRGTGPAIFRGTLFPHSSPLPYYAEHTRKLFAHRHGLNPLLSRRRDPALRRCADRCAERLHNTGYVVLEKPRPEAKPRAGQT